ncbi:MAG TPA: hypothetical protein VKX45_18430 [Bryobacteraceae bacterium]|nr:hypothetical protein [Bryobacteraceae bacterium]
MPLRQAERWGELWFSVRQQRALIEEVAGGDDYLLASDGKAWI